MANEVAEALRRAGERVLRGWCKGAAALDADGNKVLAGSNSAVSWCLIGAINAEASGPKWSSAIRAAKEVIGWGGHLADWNDSRDTAQEVADKLFEAANLVESEHGE